MKKLLFFLLPLMLLTGCASDWYMPPEKFTVEQSRLNWVQILYQAKEDAPRIRCDMRNDGIITVLEGHSVTVGDDFNIEYDKATFGDIRKYHYTMPPDLFRETLQVLVNAGLLERKPAEEEDPVYPKVLIKANINHRKIDKFTADPDLIAEIRTQLFQFKMSGQLQ